MNDPLRTWLDEQLAADHPVDDDDLEVEEGAVVDDGQPDETYEIDAAGNVMLPDDDWRPTSGGDVVAWARLNDSALRAAGWQDGGDGFLALMIDDRHEWQRVARDQGWDPDRTRPSASDAGLPDWAVSGLSLGGRIMSHDLGRRPGR